MSEQINGRTSSVRHLRPVIVRSPKEVAALGRLRRKAERAIERLLWVLDEIEGDPDLEDNGDPEPPLGWTGSEAASGRYGGVAEEEDEPSLGWTSTLNQASRQRLGEVTDLEQDDADREPSLGARENHPGQYGCGGNQTLWGYSGTSDREDDTYDNELEPDDEAEEDAGFPLSEEYRERLRERRAASKRETPPILPDGSTVERVFLGPDGRPYRFTPIPRGRP
jgi:hypothetical protein